MDGSKRKSCKSPVIRLKSLAYSYFGDRIELAEGTLVVGTNGGAFYSYRLSGDQWVLAQSYIEDVGRTSGIAMIAGLRLIVGPDPTFASDGNSVFVGFSPFYQRTDTDQDWEFGSYLLRDSSEDPAYIAFGSNGYLGDDDMEMSPAGMFGCESQLGGGVFQGF